MNKFTEKPGLGILGCCQFVDTGLEERAGIGDLYPFIRCVFNLEDALRAETGGFVKAEVVHGRPCTRMLSREFFQVVTFPLGFR